MPRLRPLVVLCLLACLAPAAAHASLKMAIGAAEDEGRTGDPALARAKMDLAKAAGFNAVRVTAVWAPGLASLSTAQVESLQSAAAAAAFDGITVTVTVMPYGSRTTPLTAAARRDFASFAADLVREVPLIRNVIVGNEPNLNRYWLPQFGPDGSDVAATAYEALLAQSYDAIKAADRTTFVIGGSVSPHGGDDPTSSRQTHSPTAFIADLGAAYRASGRAKPIMDGFAFHPYGENSSVPPTNTHPNSTSIGLGDYDKLVVLLGKAFDGTAQLGTRLPIIYDEYGIESLIPASKISLYHGREPSTTKPQPVSTQSDYYEQALLLAACQPTVRGIYLFHVTDESDLNRWQSGLYYPDGTPKPSRAVVRSTIAQIRAGAVDCSQVGADNGDWVEAPVAATPSKATGRRRRKHRVPQATSPGDVWVLVSHL